MWLVVNPNGVGSIVDRGGGWLQLLKGHFGSALRADDRFQLAQTLGQPTAKAAPGAHDKGVHSANLMKQR
jgi:hypothetical protein